MQWRIAGLDVQVAATIPGADAAVVGDTVQVTGYTTDQGDLIALTLALINPDTAPVLTETITPPAPTRTPVPTSTPLPTTCTPTMPSGWASYLIQPNDTVAGLAALTGATVEQVLAVNCLPQSQMIIAGQPIYLPKLLLPATTLAPVMPTEPPVENTAQPTVQPTTPATAEPTDDHPEDHGDD